MIPKILKKIKKHKDLIINIVIVIAIVVVFLILYKMLFYSSKESSIYGVRLRDSEKYKITLNDITKLKKKANKLENTEGVNVVLKGRLLKYFITVKEDLSVDDMKNISNEIVTSFDEKKKGYYDITFYFIVEKEDKQNYPLIGYKHKSTDMVTFVEGGKDEEKE